MVCDISSAQLPLPFVQYIAGKEVLRGEGKETLALMNYGSLPSFFCYLSCSINKWSSSSTHR